jgi:O-antigen/teichoic acid export membrane protein
MASVKTNIFANLVGSFWQAVISLLFVPFYIKFMGMESYGLVGVFITVQTLAIILDMGFSSTLNREMARRSVLSGDKRETRDLVRTLEVIYWCVAIIIGVVIIIFSPAVAEKWVKAQNLSSRAVEQAILIMGLAVALQWPAALYAGGLLGLQKQVLLNAINIFIVTVRGLGAVFILWRISPTIQAFFLWQIFISGMHTTLLSLFLWRSIKESNHHPIFQLRLIKGIFRFTAGVAFITILYIIITQLDKVILSKMLSLEMFGYYTLAGLIAMILLRIALPMFTALYPKFTQMVSLADHTGLRELYHKSSQIMAVLIFPVAVVVSLFAYELVLLWTQDSLITAKTHLLVTILTFGTAFNAIMLVPQALQLAFGWTRLLFFKNLISVIILVPLIILLADLYGAIGVSFAWVIFNISAFLLEIPIMHRRLLSGDKWKWYIQDIFVPLITALFIAGVGKLLIPTEMQQWKMFIYLIIVSVSTLAGTAVVTTATREWLCTQTVKIININRS